MEIALMDVAMGLKAKRVVAVLGMAVVGAGMFFSGGCANQKDDQIAALNSEIATLKEERAQVEQARIAAETRAQEAEAKKNIAAQPPANDPNGNTGWDRNNQPEADVRLTVAGDVAFASGQTTLKAEAKKELDGIARRLNGEFSGHRIRVEGYTDSDPIRKSKFPSNEALSEARAQAVENYLISKGVSSNRISSVGMGSAKPKATKAASRRVEIVVLGR